MDTVSDAREQAQPVEPEALASPGPPPPGISSDECYAILQVSPHSEPEVIQAAYRQLARKYHPDHHPDPRATEWMKALNAAYAVLADPQQRAAYDARQGIHQPSWESSQAAPIIYLSASQVSFGTIPTETPVTRHVTVAVYAYAGETRVTPTRAWLTVRPAAFRGLMARLSVTVDPDRLTIGEPHRGRVLLQAGEMRTIIEVEVQVVPPGIPKLAVEAPVLTLDRVPRGRPAMGLLRMANTGGGLLEGAITSSARWLDVEEHSFRGNEVRLDVVAQTHRLRAWTRHRATLRIASNGGDAVVEVEVTTRPRRRKRGRGSPVHP